MLIEESSIYIYTEAVLLGNANTSSEVRKENHVITHKLLLKMNAADNNKQTHGSA